MLQRLPKDLPMTRALCTSRFMRRFVATAALTVLTVALASGAAAPAFGMGTDGGSTTNPTIQSDQADYPPGATVTLTGANWQPGEVVHIVVDDTNGHTWSFSDDVTADDMGTIQDVFNLPSVWVSNYDVTATGSESGVVMT